MNELLFITSGILGFFGVALTAKLFGKYGLIAWVAISAILANIAVTKQVTMFGVDCTLGNIMFSSTYLATDILSEVYGKKWARMAVFAGLMAAVVFVGFGLFVNVYKANQWDYANESLNMILSFSIRTTTMSIVCFFIANYADVWLFEKFRQKSEKNLWLRNNVCTIITNCIENFLLCFGAFYGMYDAQYCLMIAATTCVVEILAALLDTPFCYLGRKWARERKEKDIQLVSAEA